MLNYSDFLMFLIFLLIMASKYQNENFNQFGILGPSIIQILIHLNFLAVNLKS